MQITYNNALMFENGSGPFIPMPGDNTEFYQIMPIQPTEPTAIATGNEQNDILAKFDDQIQALTVSETGIPSGYTAQSAITKLKFVL